MRGRFLAAALVASLAACTRSPTAPAAPTTQKRHESLGTVMQSAGAAAARTPAPPPSSPLAVDPQKLDGVLNLIR